MMSSPFTSLTPELILAIGELLSLRDLKQLRLTCQKFSDLFADHVLRSLWLFGQESKIERHASVFLSVLHSPRTSAICYSTRKVIVGPQPYTVWQEPPQFDDDPPEDDDLDDDHETLSEPPKLDVDKIVRDIVTALLACKNLSEIVWVQGSYDSAGPEPLWAALRGVIRKLPTMRRFEVGGLTFEEHLQDSLESLTHLESLTIKSINEDFNAIKKLPQIIASSPKLKALNMTFHSYETKDWKPFSLYALLEKLPAGRHLTHLTLDAFLILLDPRALPHLNSLVSLKTTYMTPSGSEEDEEATEVLWTHLQKQNIHLQELDYMKISGPLINYLSSFSGLRVLKLNVQGMESRNNHDFFSRALSRHASTLEELVIKVYYSGPWCLRTESIPYIRKCVNLKRLSIGVDCLTVLPELGKIKVGELPENDGVKRFIETILDLPALERVDMRSTEVPSRSTGLQWVDNGSIASKRKHIVAIACMYRAPRYTWRLPDLYVPSDLTLGHRLRESVDIDGRLMYVEVPKKSDRLW